MLQPDSRWAGANGKVIGAMTGVADSRHPLVVICDDDVRYGHAELSAVVTALRVADLVVPQNVPTHWPRWVWWESEVLVPRRPRGAAAAGSRSPRTPSERCAAPCRRIRLGHRDFSMTRPSQEGPR